MTGDWKVVFAAETAKDLEIIEAHLIDAYTEFGESLAEAGVHATARIEAIISAAERLAPYRGAAHDDLMPGVRHLTVDRAIYWFLPVEAERTIRVLAIFFGSQDHQRRMLIRLFGRQLAGPIDHSLAA